MKFNKQQGFTLIELVMVIVILGILAATALPKFANLSSDAREASVQGMAGALRGAVNITKSAYLAAGSTTSTSVNGVAVAAATGIPTSAAGGIGGALESIEGFTPVYGGAPVTFTPSGGSATCQATYDATTGAVAAVVTAC